MFGVVVEHSSSVSLAVGNSVHYLWLKLAACGCQCDDVKVTRIVLNSWCKSNTVYILCYISST